VPIARPAHALGGFHPFVQLGGRAVLPERSPNLVPLGEAAQGALGEDALAVLRDLEDAAAAGDQLEGGDVGAEMLKQLLRQTDGAGQIVSSGAVFDADSHHSARFGRLKVEG
jgi:hypothetical protein